MYGSVFNIKNTSSTPQTVDLYDTSDQSGKPTTFVWRFEKDWSAVFNGTNWFTGAVGSPFWRVNFTNSFGVPQDQSLISAGLVNITTAAFETLLNTNVVATQFGTWTITTDGTNATFQCILNNPPTNTGGLTLTTSTYGAISLFLSSTMGNDTCSASTIPSNFYNNAVKNNPNITISSFSDFSYDQFLWSTVQRTYAVKNFQVWSTSQSQLLEPFLFDRKTATGKKFQKVLTPTVDPYQYQNYVVTPENKGYILDGFTKIKYRVLGSTEVRLILDYTFIDGATPLVAKVVKPKTNPDLVTPKFVDTMEKGYDKFGCEFLLKESEKLSKKLKTKNLVKSKKIDLQLKSELSYIKQLMINYECMPKGQIEELPSFEALGSEYKRLDLWMPSPEFVQNQLDSEQGVRKMFDKFDFPIVVKDW